MILEPHDYKTCALPIELKGLVDKDKSKTHSLFALFDGLHVIKDSLNESMDD